VIITAAVWRAPAFRTTRERGWSAHGPRTCLSSFCIKLASPLGCGGGERARRPHATGMGDLSGGMFVLSRDVGTRFIS
jgi:hypothetical protein